MNWNDAQAWVLVSIPCPREYSVVCSRAYRVVMSLESVSKATYLVRLKVKERERERRRKQGQLGEEKLVWCVSLLGSSLSLYK